MARISDSELDRLKREVSLLALVEAAGITLKRHGKDYLGLCPFHDDKEPSLVISPEKNLWHCLGACCRAPNYHRIFSQTSGRRILKVYDRFASFSS